MDTGSWLGHYCQIRNDEDITRNGGPGESERVGEVKKSLKGKGRCLGSYLGIQMGAASTTKSEMRGPGREVIPE